YIVPHSMPLDPDLLDPDDPFEVDARNRPHLHKHDFWTPEGRYLKVDIDDIRDLWAWGAVVLLPPYQEEGDADWLLVVEIEGVLIVVPIAPSDSGAPEKCRPIGIYPGTHPDVREGYQREMEGGY